MFLNLWVCVANNNLYMYLFVLTLLDWRSKFGNTVDRHVMALLWDTNERCLYVFSITCLAQARAGSTFIFQLTLKQRSFYSNMLLEWLNNSRDIQLSKLRNPPEHNYAGDFMWWQMDKRLKSRMKAVHMTLSIKKPVCTEICSLALVGWIGSAYTDLRPVSLTKQNFTFLTLNHKLKTLKVIQVKY